MPAQSLHALLVAKRAELLTRWEQWVKDELTSNTMSSGELVDSMPLFFEELITALAQGQASKGTQPLSQRANARVHGSERLHIGFDVSTVVREYNLLRRAILDLVEIDGLILSAFEMRTMSDLISEAQAEAVTEYQRQRDETQMRQAAEHLGFLAHELRNPISAAFTAFTLLRGETLASGGKFVDVLERNLRRTVELLDNALLVGRLQGAPLLHREHVDLRVLANEARDEALVDAEHRKLSLVVEAHDELIIDADMRLLRSVLSNLVRNGIKFSRPGTRVVVRAHRSEASVIVEVEDGCGGLPEEKMNAIFDPHVQIGMNRSGFGLGLAIAKQAAEAHGGTLQVHNVEGQGCLFRLELPTTA